MIAIETFIIIVVVTLLIGAGVGVAIGRAWVRPAHQKSLERQLSTAQQSLDTYQQDVAKHFLETANKVSDLSESYRNLHDHLATGALSLANTEIGKELIAAGDQPPASGRIGHTSVEAPKDWAPRKPGKEGTLSEEYDLKDHDNHEVASAPKAPKGTATPKKDTAAPKDIAKDKPANKVETTPPAAAAKVNTAASHTKA